MVAAGMLAFPAVTHWREQEPIVAPEMRLEIATPSTAFANSFALSPDGRQIVYSIATDGVSQLWLRAMDSGVARLLPGTEEGRDPFWSADGRSIGFFAESLVKRIDVAGGVPRALAPAVPGLGGTWNGDGVILFASGTAGALQRVSASGGAATLATKLAPGDSVHGFPTFLPDQQRFVVFVTGQRPGLYLGSLASPDLKWLAEADSGAAFLAPRWLLFVRGEALVARRFDSRNERVSGEPVVVAEPINVTRVPAVNIPFSVSTSGVLAYRSRGSTRRQLVWVDRTGKRLSDATAATDEEMTNPEISPDGRRIVAELSRDNNQDIWVFDGPRRVRISTDPARDAFSTWSHDGSRILFGSQRTGRLAMFERPSDGSGTETRLQGSPDGVVPLHVSRDGQFVTYLGTNQTTREDIGVLPLVGERKPRLFTETVSTELFSQFSPDGKWIAYQSNETGMWELYLRPFPGPGGQWPISTSGGIHVRWSHDGKEVYYLSLDGRMMAVSVSFSGSTPVLGTPVALFNAGLINGGSQILGLRQQYDVAKDGRFLLNVPAAGGTMPPITVLLNWAPLREQ